MLRAITDIAKALADENRMRMLYSLRQQELCVCQLIEFSGLAPSTASKHMSILRQARLVEARKDGRWVHYRLAGDDAPAEAREAVAWVCRSLDDDPRADQDRQRLAAILQEDPEVLCKRQMGRSKCCSSAPETPAEARSQKASPATSAAT
jgi:ArsR family transcriptional regulator, arsenate/arsenite/antimonite-responsive transcriptional repressor